MNVVGETLACFLSTTAPEMDAKGMGGKAKIQPPIRFEKDRERLWRGIEEGTISVVGTDSLCSRADYSLWEGRRVRGIPVMTLLRGRVVMQDGEIVEDRPGGRFVPQVVRPRGTP
jgi:dihydroorotase-like cyclic amidohydrolase